MKKLCEWLNGPAFRPPGEDERVPFGFLLVRPLRICTWLGFTHTAMATAEPPDSWNSGAWSALASRYPPHLR